MGHLEKTGIEIGDIRRGKFTEAEGIERLASVLDHVVVKMHCPPCDDLEKDAAILNDPKTGLVPRMTETETRSKSNTALLYASLIVIAVYLFTLTMTILTRISP